MGFKMLKRLQVEAEPEALDEEERPRLRFKPMPNPEDGNDEDSQGEQDEASVAMPPVPRSSTGVVKQEVDIKPRLATQFRSANQLCKLLCGHDDCIVTHIQRDEDPMSHFVEDDPVKQQVVELSSDKDLEEVEDLSDNSEEATPVMREELTKVLKNLADSRRVTGECLDMLVKLTEEMTSDQVEETAGEVAHQFQGCKGLADSPVQL